MSELRTKAGRRLLAYLLVEPLVEKKQREQVVLNDILAIEAEASVPTVERLAAAIHEASIHMAHGDPEAQARRIINVLEGREWHEDTP